MLNATEDDESGLESKSESHIPSNVGNAYSESETLNSPITEDEVSKSVKRLKNGKACGEDCILDEMIKAFSEDHLHLLTQTFNVVLLSGHIPNEGATGVIKPIYINKGDINDSDNYRGITLLSCLGKLFTSVIYSMRSRILNCENSIVVCLNDCFYIRGRYMWTSWQKSLYTV